MRETYPSSHNGEKEKAIPDLDFIASQIYDMSCLPQFNFEEDEEGTPQDRLKVLSDLAKSGPLESTLNLAGYFREDGDWDDDGIQLVRIGLMTPNYIESQSRFNQCSREYEANRSDNAKKEELRELLRELVDYNSTLKDVIKAYPNFGAKRLAHFLQGDAMWLDMPEERRKQAEKQINSVINGARGEIIFEEVLNSHVMKSAGVEYRETPIQDDVWGIDCCVDVTFGVGKEQLVVNLPIDVKSTAEQVANSTKSRRSLSVQSPAYAIKDNAVIMWCGIDLHNLYDNLLPDSETIDKKAEQMLPLIHMAASDYYSAYQKGLVIPYQPAQAA